MRSVLRTAGEVAEVDCHLGWLDRLLAEATVGSLTPYPSADPTMSIRIERAREGFETKGWSPLARGAWRRGSSVVLRNVCTSGFDMHLGISDDHPTFTFRWRPPPTTRGANLLLRGRFHLLARAALLQYPALWWAGTRGRVPLHASVLTAGPATPLLLGASGAGKSTLVAAELGAGGRATSDNVCSADGVTAWGLVEPLRIEGRTGRRMPHGRREVPFESRAESLKPDCMVLLRRGNLHATTLRPVGSEVAARHLVTDTYIAGELRRYWGFAATLAAGTGLGPAHPRIDSVAEDFAVRLPSFEVAIAQGERARLGELLEHEETNQCA